MWEGVSGKLVGPGTLVGEAEGHLSDRALSGALTNRHVQVADLVHLKRAPSPSIPFPQSISPATKVIFLFSMSLAGIDVHVSLCPGLRSIVKFSRCDLWPTSVSLATMSKLSR